MVVEIYQVGVLNVLLLLVIAGVVEINHNTDEVDEGELIEGGSNGGELERKIQRRICVTEKARVGAIDVFADLWTLGALIPVSTAYKRQKDKIRPLDLPTDGEGTRGDLLFLEKSEKQEAFEGHHTPKGPFNVWITLKFSSITQGSRLIEERIADLNIWAELWPHKKVL